MSAVVWVEDERGNLTPYVAAAAPRVLYVSTTTTEQPAAIDLGLELAFPELEETPNG